jgi:outer membrane protein OmpA-like peptidoglycan-associated protein
VLAPAATLPPLAVPPTAPPPAQAPPPPAAPQPPPAPTASIWFAPGSANLPQSEVANLAMLAGTSRGARFAVTGFGDANAPDPVALGRARALAVAAALRQAGVPAGMITTTGEAPAEGAPGARLRVLP